MAKACAPRRVSCRRPPAPWARTRLAGTDLLLRGDRAWRHAAKEIIGNERTGRGFVGEILDNRHDALAVRDRAHRQVAVRPYGWTWELGAAAREAIEILAVAQCRGYRVSLLPADKR